MLRELRIDIVVIINMKEKYDLEFKISTSKHQKFHIHLRYNVTYNSQIHIYIYSPINKSNFNRLLLLEKKLYIFE